MKPYVNSIISKQNYVSDWQDYISEEYLLNCFGKDIPKNIDNNIFRLYEYVEMHDQLIDIVEKSYPDYEVKRSGDFHYPKTG